MAEQNNFAMRRSMPARGHATAPTFDSSEPRNLRRFFQDLETLFEITGVMDPKQQKKWVTQYVPIKESEFYEEMAEFKDETKTFKEFHSAIYAAHPGASETRKFSNAEVDQLLESRSRAPITTSSELGEFYRPFYAMTSYLIQQNKMSAFEQSRLFVRGLCNPLRDQVSQRLQLKDPDHHLDEAYELAKVYEVAKFILHGTTAVSYQVMPAIPQTAVPADNTSIKVEDLAPLFHLLAQGGNNANAATTANRFLGPLNAGAHPAPNYQGMMQGAQGFQQGGNGFVTNALPNSFCHFCGDANHMLWNCPAAETNIREGKCSQNPEGLIVLPTGQFLPRQLPGFDGLTMRNRLYEWHRRERVRQGQNPAPAAQMVFAITEDMEPWASSFQFTAEDRIQQLEHELYMLKRGKEHFDGVEIPSFQKPSFAPPKPNAAVLPPRPVPLHLKPALQFRETVAAGDRERSVHDTTIRTTENQVPEQPRPQERPGTPYRAPADQGVPLLPEHPFAKARDATYAPPNVRAFGAPPAKPKEQERNDSRDHVSTEELLSLAPEVRAKFHEAVTPRRVPPTGQQTVAFASVGGAQGAAETEQEELSCFGTPLEPGGFVLPDLYDVYLRDVAPSGESPPLKNAKELHALWSIVGLVDTKEYVEAIVDPGCMIVAMSEHVCHHLGLLYDPTIRLNMQSANGEVEKSLGLVQNMPFKVSTIVVYLQVHVVCNAAYDMLLGRPFDVLTKSVIKNFDNEDQTITIKCPNTGQIATIPTIPRGRARFRARPNPEPVRPEPTI
ncbi:uncharacterized protein TRAVEDRAFT_48115 [Trametes versicolor FP-101664 SS1]|uniref:uncharacterized protein n=1 Tax=Trametes versicolor (strain FP-101664) TaxID=717944 RepID=UPI0004623C52|nr:uncharacterized protein TRAVEDRAFT_48115 [Trametes versicolor FP-101664 SS1]EIW58983.1 hypothetical protein TRAVEDRAFT_48115 [Trametes versicolor FP-101664 SS1]